MDALDRIIEITEAVEQFVERGAWVEARVLDEERRRMLQDLLHGESSNSGTAHREFLQELLRRNEDTVQRLGKRRRDLLADAAGEINAGRSIARAYNEHGSPQARTRLRAVSGGERS